jgi:hypothetical protein
MERPGQVIETYGLEGFGQCQRHIAGHPDASSGRSKVYELFSSGDLESVKIDRSRLVRSSDLRAYVDGLRPADKSA